jgi:hypothetical protein
MTGLPGLLISNIWTSEESVWKVARKLASSGLNAIRSSGAEGLRPAEAEGDDGVWE